jgi:hypothetical protein
MAMGSKTLVIAAALTVIGSALLIGAVGTAAGDVPVGPGPTYYTVQRQPAPGACHYRTAANGQTLPDPDCTPGAISPKVTQDTLATTICRTGYTKSIRPPASITEIEKRENARKSEGEWAGRRHPAEPGIALWVWGQAAMSVITALPSRMTMCWSVSACSWMARSRARRCLLMRDS